VNERLVELGKRFARVATRAVVARPALWPLFRGPLRRQFDWLAPVWDECRSSESLAWIEEALARLDREPRRVLDVGTGTGVGARALARRYPKADVVGVDLSPAMIAEAQRLVPPDLDPRLRFAVADAAELPFDDDAFDLVVLLNMIPFFDELARVTAPGGTVVFAWSSGAETPIYTRPEVVRQRLTSLRFAGFDEIAAGDAVALVARRER
jgi:SAM-dependent methyltransferase